MQRAPNLGMMGTENRRDALSEEKADELLAAELDMTVEELREGSELDLAPPWEGDIVRDHEEPE